jgi:transport family protein 27
MARPKHGPFVPAVPDADLVTPQMGDPAVGKSALAQMFHSGGNRFPKVYNMTCGVDFSVKAVTVPSTDEAVEFHVFDTAGQDIFAEMMPSYWEGAKGVVLVFDVTRAHTLEACGHWYGRLLETLGTDALPGVLVANKTDLRERTVIQRAQGQQMASSLNMQARAPPPVPPIDSTPVRAHTTVSIHP